MRTQRGGIVVGVAIGCAIGATNARASAADETPSEIGMEETVSSGLAYSSTFHFATTFAFDAALRWRRWKLGGFAHYAVGTYGNATSFGARVGPSIGLGPLELDATPTFGWRRYFDVGAVHWPSDVTVDFPCIGYDGVAASTPFVGIGLDLHRAPLHGVNFLWALSAYYAHDLHRTHVIDLGSAGCDPTRGFAVPVDTQIGGEQIGIALRFGVDAG